MSDSRTPAQEVLAEAMAAAAHCIKLVVEGDPNANPEGHASVDRKNNAQAALALVQAAKTLTLPPRRQP